MDDAPSPLRRLLDVLRDAAEWDPPRLAALLDAAAASKSTSSASAPAASDPAAREDWAPVFRALFRCFFRSPGRAVSRTRLRPLTTALAPVLRRFASRDLFLDLLDAIDPRTHSGGTGPLVDPRKVSLSWRRAMLAVVRALTTRASLLAVVRDQLDERLTHALVRLPALLANWWQRSLPHSLSTETLHRRLADALVHRVLHDSADVDPRPLRDLVARLERVGGLPALLDSLEAAVASLVAEQHQEAEAGVYEPAAAHEPPGGEVPSSSSSASTSPASSASASSASASLGAVLPDSAWERFAARVLESISPGPMTVDWARPAVRLTRPLPLAVALGPVDALPDHRADFVVHRLPRLVSASIPAWKHWILFVLARTADSESESESKSISSFPRGDAATASATPASPVPAHGLRVDLAWTRDAVHARRFVDRCPVDALAEWWSSPELLGQRPTRLDTSLTRLLMLALPWAPPSVAGLGSAVSFALLRGTPARLHASRETIRANGMRLAELLSERLDPSKPLRFDDDGDGDGGGNGDADAGGGSGSDGSSSSSRRPHGADMGARPRRRSQPWFETLWGDDVLGLDAFEAAEVRRRKIAIAALEDEEGVDEETEEGEEEEGGEDVGEGDERGAMEARCSDASEDVGGKEPRPRIASDGNAIRVGGRRERRSESWANRQDGWPATEHERDESSEGSSSSSSKYSSSTSSSGDPRSVFRAFAIPSGEEVERCDHAEATSLASASEPTRAAPLPPPRFLRECLDRLRAASTANEFEVCVSTLAALVRTPATDRLPPIRHPLPSNPGAGSTSAHTPDVAPAPAHEVRDLALTAMHTLLHLDNKYNLDAVPEWRFRALLALAEREPATAARQLLHSVFAPEVALSTRLDALDVLVETALTLAFGSDSTASSVSSASPASFSPHVPPRGRLVEELDSRDATAAFGDSGPQVRVRDARHTPKGVSEDLVRVRGVDRPRTRRWGTPAHERKAPAVSRPNRFVDLTVLFFSPLLRGLRAGLSRSADRLAVDLRDQEVYVALLARGLHAAGVILECGARHPRAPALADELLAFLWVLRGHEQALVRRSVLVALAAVVTVVAERHLALQPLSADTAAALVAYADPSADRTLHSASSLAPDGVVVGTFAAALGDATLWLQRVTETDADEAARVAAASLLASDAFRHVIVRLVRAREIEHAARVGGTSPLDQLYRIEV